MAVGIDKFFRNEINLFFKDGIKSRLRQLLHFEEPLVAKLRFYHRTCTFTCSYFVNVFFGFYKDPLFLKLLNYFFSCVKPVHSLILQSVGVKTGIVMKYINYFKIVFISQHFVIFVVRGSNF